MSSQAPLQWNKLTFFDDHFEDRGRAIPYSEVVALDFVRVAQSTSVNFIPTGTKHIAVLNLRLAEGRTVEISYGGEQSLLNPMAGELKEMQVLNIYELIAPRTYRTRLQKYLNELEQKGYFTFDAKRFQRDGCVAEGSKLADLRTCPIRKIAGVGVRFEVPPAKGGFKRLMEVLWEAPSIGVQTTTDGDCFLALLRSLYGVRWFKSEGEVFGTARSFGGGLVPDTDFDFAAPRAFATDFHRTDVDRFVGTCVAMAKRVAEMAVARIRERDLAYGVGWDALDHQDEQQILGEARREPESAFLWFSFGLLVLIGCTHNPQFPSTADYQQIQNLVGGVIVSRRANSLPKAIRVWSGEALTKLLARQFVSEVKEMWDTIQEVSLGISAQHPFPFLPMWRALAERTRLWNPDDHSALAEEFHRFTLDLSLWGAKTLGVEVAPGAGVTRRRD